MNGPKKMKSYSILFIAIVIYLASHVFAEAKCEQKFVLFDKTVGDHSLMFYRLGWSGECGYTQSTFYTLFILPDRVHSTSSTSLYGNWVPRLYENMELESYEVLTETDGYYYLNDTTYFSVPRYDSCLENRYNSLPKKDVKTWYWECFDSCSAPPQFYNFTPESIYHHPGGLYINYSYSEVRYYRESNFLILLTDQPKLDENNRTMNGMIILKVDGYQW